MNILERFINSFDTKNEGFSARKLTAFTFVLLAGYIHYEYVNVDNAIEALIIDSATALLCLGIITAQNIINFKNGREDKTNEQTEDTQQ